MTTKVTIFNHGPDKVIVSRAQVGASSSALTGQQVLEPGMAFDQYVYNDSEVRIQEVQETTAA